jgi:uncharacterized protein (TIGR03086 family)
MTPLESCQQVLENTRRVVDQVRPEQFDKATPCAEWDVRMLVNHMVGVLDGLEAPARGEQIQFSAQKVDDVVGMSPSSAFSKKAAEFVAAWSAPGATDRVVTTMFGEQPAEFYLGLATADMLLHGWDLATAIGVPYSMDEAAAGSVLERMQAMLKPEMRGPGKAFAEEVPASPNASLQERLVAFSGRRAP